MNMADLRRTAKDLGIRSFGKTKVALVREIQIKQGNFDCFAKVKDFCDQLECRFRKACFKEAAKREPARRKARRSAGGQKPPDEGGASKPSRDTATETVPTRAVSQTKGERK